jgi:hypothetical protein
MGILACSPVQSDDAVPAEGEPVEQTEEITDPEKEGASEEPKKPTQEQDELVDGMPPDTIDIELEIEGFKETRVGTLVHGSLGYYLYTLPNFKLVSEEPNRDLLFFTNDPEFFVRIEGLDPNADPSFLRENAEKELALVGDVVEKKGQEIAEEFFPSSIFFLHASNPQHSKNIIVVSVDGKMFKFTMSMPNKEAAEGVTPAFFSMLKTKKTHK